MNKVTPYRGSAPYIFISYAHKDSQSVIPIIGTMQGSGFRIWFDEGIDPGTEWDNVIATQIEKCDYFLAFVSENYLASENCKDELNFARDLGKHRLLVYLEDVTLPSGMAMRMNRIQSVFKYKYIDEKGFYDVLYTAEGIDAMCDGEPKYVTKDGTPSGAPPHVGNTVPPSNPIPPQPQAPIQKATPAYEIVKAFEAGAAWFKRFFTKPTPAQLFTRMAFVFVYAFLITAKSGLPRTITFAILTIISGILAVVTTIKEKKENPVLYAALKKERKKRSQGFAIAAHVSLFLAVGYYGSGEAATLFFLFWSVYCYFASFVPKGYKKLAIGLFTVRRLPLRLLSLLFSLIVAGFLV